MIVIERRVIMSEQQLENKFLNVIPQAMRVIRSEVRAVASSELTVPQFRILNQISNSKGLCNNTVLADVIGISTPAMSRMVNGLIRLKLISQLRDRKDRRSVHLGLTEKGRELIESIKFKAQQSLELKFSVLPEEKRQSLIESLNTIDEICGS